MPGQPDQQNPDQFNPDQMTPDQDGNPNPLIQNPQGVTNPMPQLYQPAYGTFGVLDTIASTSQTIAQIGEDTAFAAIDVALRAHNQQVQELMRDFVDISEDRLRRFGTSVQMKMVKTDEWGASDAQKVKTAQTIGFPLQLGSISVQWTKKAFQNMRGDEFAAQFNATLDADLIGMITDIKKALFNGINYVTEDRLVDYQHIIPLPIKALLNADGLPIPPGPNNEQFNAATHTHYLGVATASTPLAAEIKALVRHVTEHFSGGEPQLYINLAQEDTVRALTGSGFTAYSDARVIYAITNDRAAGVLDTTQIYNRPIGIFASAVVSVKPWIPPGYMFAWMKGQNAPMVMRVRNKNDFRLEIASDAEEHPLRARQFEREYGVGVWTRSNGAILDTTTGGGLYTAPQIDVVQY